MKPISFCNREAKRCHFKCNSDDCSAESIAIRDQVVIGLVNEDIRQEALKMSWCLDDPRSSVLHPNVLYTNVSINYV